MEWELSFKMDIEMNFLYRPCWNQIGERFHIIDLGSLVKKMRLECSTGPSTLGKDNRPFCTQMSSGTTSCSIWLLTVKSVGS